LKHQVHQNPFIPCLSSGRSTVPYGSSTIPYDRSTIPYDRSTVPYDISTVPYDSSTVPYDRSTVPYDISTVPYDSSTIPYDRSIVPYYRSTSWNRLGHTGPVTGLLYLYLYLKLNTLPLKLSIVSRKCLRKLSFFCVRCTIICYLFDTSWQQKILPFFMSVNLGVLKISALSDEEIFKLW
jgi:hypothetical protein